MDNKAIKLSVKEIGESSVKSIVSAIPLLGGPISSLLGAYFSGRKEKRFLDFIEGIQEDLKDTVDNINEGFVSKDDFYDIFELTARKIVLTRQEEKRTAYRKILTNSMISNNISYDEMEEFNVLLDSMRAEHILMLKILKNPIEYDEEHGNLVGKGGGFSTSLNQIMKSLLSQWESEFVIDILEGLEKNRLVKGITSSYNTMMTDQGINHLNNKLTQKGIKFCDFILG